MPYVRDRNGPVFNASGDKPSSTFRSGTSRFPDKAAVGPGFKYDPTLVQPDHDYLTASANSAFASRTARFAQRPGDGPGFKYNNPVEHKEDPNAPGAYAAFRSTTQRIPERLNDGPGFKYNNPVEHKEDPNAPGAYAAFRSTSPRIPERPADGPGFKYNNPVEHKEDPNAPGAYAAFRSTTQRIPERPSATAGLSEKHYPLSHPLDMVEQIRMKEHIPSAAFRSKAARFKDKEAYGGDRPTELKHPGDISVRCAPRDNTKGVGFASSAPRFRDPTPAGNGKVYDPPINSIAWTVAGPTGGATSAFQSRAPRFPARPPQGADHHYTYNHPLEIHSRVGDYMMR